MMCEAFVSKNRLKQHFLLESKTAGTKMHIFLNSYILEKIKQSSGTLESKSEEEESKILVASFLAKPLW